MWRKDKDGRDKLQTLKGHVNVPTAGTDTAAIIERIVSQLVINAQTYKVPELPCWMVSSKPCCDLLSQLTKPAHTLGCKHAIYGTTGGVLHPIVAAGPNPSGAHR